MQYLLLSRHGNTFAPGQKVVWVGAANDLTLVDSGLLQAQSLALALKDASIKPEKVYAAKLKRTSVYAQVIHDQLNLTEDVIIDNRLNEIDYGDWSGLTSDEIKDKFGQNELLDWNQNGKWPKTFIGLESEIEQQVKSFVEENIEKRSDHKIILAVTSNGRLKYFLKLLSDLYKDYVQTSKWKVATGNICLLSYDRGDWRLVFWNEKPESKLSLALIKR